MNSVGRGRRGGTRVAIAGVIILGAVMVAGVVLRPWPLLSWMYMGRVSPIEHVVELVFDYPGSRAAAGLFIRDAPLDVRVITLLPVAVQAVVVVLLTITTARVLAAISRGAAFTARARRSLKVLSVVGIVGGLVQFGVGVLAWKVGSGWLDLDPEDPGVRLYSHMPFPEWPITLVIIGLLAAALGVAFRAGARLEEDLDGVV